MPRQISGMDVKNARIINLLKKDGRMSFAEIASRVELSENAVINRLKRLRESGQFMGYTVSVRHYGWFLIKLRDRDNFEHQQAVEKTIAEFASGNLCVTEAFRSMGWFDYVVTLMGNAEPLRFELIQALAKTAVVQEHSWQENLGGINLL
jgi:DNA-binding Lrp family transcriptional regulator